MTVYPFLGHETRSYPQYRDNSTGVMLIADPGGAYEMEPVQGVGPVAVPPSDGLWGERTADVPAQAKASKAAKTAAPAAEGTG